MATETLILRPTSWYSVASGAYECYPASTSADDYYLLVSEEVADDDSTYIYTGATMPSSGFLFTPPDFDIVPTAIRVIARMSTSVSESTAFIVYRTASGSNPSLDKITLSEQYETYMQSIPSDYLLDFWNNIVSLTNGSCHVSFYAGTNSSSSKATKEVKLTQLYLEIDYDNSSGETIYFKENGTWTSTPCTIYKKQDGAWAVTDSTVFENGDKFIVQQIT